MRIREFFINKFYSKKNYHIADNFKRIYFYHIRKSGGTSLNHSFFALAGDHEKVYYRLVSSKEHYINYNAKVFAGWSKKLAEKGNYFYSFSHIPAHKLNLPPQTFKISIMRDPVKRVLSLYKMLVYFQDNQIDHECMKVEGKWLGDNFSDFLDRIPKKDLLNQLYMFSANFNVDEALINIKKCNYVFYTENYNAGIKKLAEKLNLDLKIFNERKAQNYFEPQEKDLIKLKELLKSEIIFYNRVKEIFN